jgi:hypothetical protein
MRSVHIEHMVYIIVWSYFAQNDEIYAERRKGACLEGLKTNREGTELKRTLPVWCKDL